MFLFLLGLFLSNSFAISSSTPTILQDFDRMMKLYERSFNIKYQQENNLTALRLLRNLYKTNHISNIQKSETVKIPKIIHQIWVGSNPIPEFAQELAESWKNLHPEWQYILWTNENIGDILNAFSAEHREIYYKYDDTIEQSNLLRYYILYLYGGLYADMDFKCLKSFEELHTYYDFYTGISANDCREVICNALIGAKPGHYILKNIIENLHDIENPNLDKKNLRFLRSGVMFFSDKVIKSIAIAPGINIVLPCNVFYPVSFNVNITQADFHIQPESMAIHYWASCTNSSWSNVKKS